MTKKKECTEWTICGRAVGRASGWDQSDTFAMMLYDFDPAPGYAGPSGDVLFNFEAGTIESFNKDGSVKASVDLLGALYNLPLRGIVDPDDAGERSKG